MIFNDLILDSSYLYQIEEDCEINTRSWDIHNAVKKDPTIGKTEKVSKYGSNKQTLYLKKGDRFRIVTFSLKPASSSEIRMEVIAPRFKGLQFKTVPKLKFYEYLNKGGEFLKSSLFQAKITKINV